MDRSGAGAPLHRSSAVLYNNRMFPRRREAVAVGRGCMFVAGLPRERTGLEDEDLARPVDRPLDVPGRAEVPFDGYGRGSNLPDLVFRQTGLVPEVIRRPDLLGASR